jgi:hypothetical protein
MKSLFELRTARVAVAAVAAVGLSASLGSGVAAAAKGKPPVAVERKAAAGKKADERRPVTSGEGRKVG